MSKHGDDTPYQFAPEICIEVLSPSNSAEEMNEKIKLYLEKGAHEVWLCNKSGEVSYYDASSLSDLSCPKNPFFGHIADAFSYLNH